MIRRKTIIIIAMCLVSALLMGNKCDRDDFLGATYNSIKTMDIAHERSGQVLIDLKKQDVVSAEIWERAANASDSYLAARDVLIDALIIYADSSKDNEDANKSVVTAALSRLDVIIKDILALVNTFLDNPIRI